MIKFNYDKETGITVATLKYKNKTFVGQSQCHPEDSDMASEYTGSYIAGERLTINLLTHIKDNEVKPAIDTLKKMLNICRSYPDYDKDNKIIKRLNQELNENIERYELICCDIKKTKQDLNTYIQEKDKVYRKIRRLRQSN